MLSSNFYPHLEQESRLFVSFVRGQILPEFFFSHSLALEELLKSKTYFRNFASCNYIRLSSNNKHLTTAEAYG